MPRSFLRGFSAVDHPRDAEPIDEHTKSGGPKCLLERDLNRSVLCQAMKYAFCLCLVLDANHHGEALRFLIMIRRNVSTRQYLAVYL
jgi:hypothetical protein